MGYNFDGGDYHHLYETDGKESIDGTFHFTRHSFLGSEYNDGKADAFQKVKDGIDVGGLQDQAQGWENVHSHIAAIHTRLAKAHTDLFEQGWSGDDADKAEKTFRDTTNSVLSIKDSSNNMQIGTKRIATAAAAACGTGSDGPSGGAKFVNATIGPFGGNGDGDADEQAYFTLVNEVDGGRQDMPSQVEWQTKTNATGQQGGADPNAGGPHSGSGVNGVTAPGASGSPQHLSTKSPSISKAPDISHPGTDNPNLTNHPGTDGNGDGLDNGTSGLNGSGLSGTSSLGSGSGVGSYHGGPGLDTSSSLAGYDPSGGAGGGGLGAGGGLSGGAGSASGLGSAGSGLGSGAGVSGGAGFAGSGAGLAGGGSGVGRGGAGGGGTGSGAAGRGGVGGQVAPMRGGGGGGGGDESERERSTWLQEEDDVWGGSDAPPSVIS